MATVTTLVLWDVDGTLVRTGAWGAAVFDDAMEEVVGRRPPERIHMGGMTDPQIVGEYLAMLGEPDVAATVDAVCAALARRLAAVADRLVADGWPCAGAGDALAALRSTDGVVSTLLTGNIAPNAQVKLAAWGLDALVDLSVGAYGSDDRDRERLVPIAVRRTTERYGRPDRVWVVGDTPRDLACARAGGAHCLLVGSGRVPASELRRLGADAVLESLEDTEEVLDILLTSRRGPGAQPGH